MTTPALGVFLPTMAVHGEAMDDVVVAASHAEDLGFESAWAVDQLVSGTGVPIVDSTVALSAAAGATTRLLVGYGVMILPLRAAVWAAKQVASLQQVSHGRLLLGVGVGGDRHDRSWAAAGVPRRERGRRTDDALAVLPDLVAGRPVDDTRLAPGVAIPPIIVGGTSEAALARTVAHGDGWFAMPLAPDRLLATLDRLRELAEARRRAMPAVTGSVMVAFDGDPSVPDTAALVRRLSDPDGLFGIPEHAIDDVLVAGPPSAVADRLAAWQAVGADRVVVTFAAGDWRRQADLLAEAVRLAG